MKTRYQVSAVDPQTGSDTIIAECETLAGAARCARFNERHVAGGHSRVFFRGKLLPRKEWQNG